MGVLSHRAIVEAARKHPGAAAALDNWYRIARRAVWERHGDVRKDFGHADFVEGLTVFNIKGNRYRLTTRVIYPTQKVFVRAFLTHAEYNRGGWKR